MPETTSFAPEYRRPPSVFSRKRARSSGRTASLCRGAAAVLVFGAALVLGACGRSGGSERVTLPPTPVLSVRSTWAVVKSPLLRVRDTASNQGTVLSHIRMGAVMEVLTRGDKEDSVESETGYWYRIDYQGLRGWVFGSYIELFDTRAKADKFSASLQ
ncbi:MAG TPA: SH3 domain-containing protein [Spirochaetia bacterium]|nr:SH3 domain-containing protein [Spirochaetia bacterium]